MQSHNANVPVFVWWEVESPTTFLKTTELKVNLCDQQWENDQDDYKQQEKQIDYLIGGTSKTAL